MELLKVSAKDHQLIKQSLDNKGSELNQEFKIYRKKNVPVTITLCKNLQKRPRLFEYIDSYVSYSFLHEYYSLIEPETDEQFAIAIESVKSLTL